MRCPARNSEEQEGEELCSVDILDEERKCVPETVTGCLASSQPATRRSVLAQLGPLPVNDHRPQVGLLPHTLPWAVHLAQRQLHGQGISSLRATRREAIATPVPPARGGCACCAGRPSSGPRCDRRACTRGKGSCSRIVHCNRFNVATTAPKVR